MSYRSNLINRSNLIDYEIPFVVSGRAGETKTVSRGLSDDGALRLFRPEKIYGTDSARVPNTGTIINARSGEHWVFAGVRGKGLSTRYCNGLHETCYSATCHPRLPVSLTVHFVEDCTWSGAIYGRARIVPDEGVYAITPTVPCRREIPLEYRDVSRDDNFGGTWYEGSNLDNFKQKRCDHCWFELVKHASWAWRERQYLLESVLAPGIQDLFISVQRRFLVHRMSVPGYDELHGMKEVGDYYDSKFRLRALEQPGRPRPLRYSKDEKGPWAGFRVGCLPWILAEAGEQIRVSVENMSQEPRLFKAAVQGDERI